MADIISKGTLFPKELVPELIKMTKGHSSLARLCASEPLPFNGQTEFTFALDKEVDVVAENGAMSKGGATIAPVTIVPVKVEYGTRISDEFLYANESVQLDYMKAFSDGFAAKIGKGLDLMALHGWNPRTMASSSVIGDNHFDSKVDQSVTIASNTADADIESAIALVNGSEFDVTGLLMAPDFKASLAGMVDKSGRKIYPELAWGNAPGTINGLTTETNLTVSANSSTDRALVGDFHNYFRWGIARDIALEIIKYGNPDNDTTLGDLKGHGQIYLRGTTYLGWGILAPKAFAMIKSA